MKMIVPTVHQEQGPVIHRAATQTTSLMKTTSQKKTSLLMKYNIGEDFLIKTPTTLAVTSSVEHPPIGLEGETVDLTGIKAASSAEDIVAHSEHSSTEDISAAQSHVAQSVAPPPPPSPPKWSNETPDLTSNEVYGVDEFTAEPSAEKKKKFLRRSNEGEIIKFPPVYVH